MQRDLVGSLTIGNIGINYYKD